MDNAIKKHPALRFSGSLLRYTLNNVLREEKGQWCKNNGCISGNLVMPGKTHQKQDYQLIKDFNVYKHARHQHHN